MYVCIYLCIYVTIHNLQELGSKKQHFLEGHSNMVSCLACSPSGSLLASGQITHMGFKVIFILQCH